MRSSFLVVWLVAGSVVAGCNTAAMPMPAASRRVLDIDILLKPETLLIRGLVPPNSTLEALLRTHDLTGETVHGLITAARTVFDPRRLRASQPFELVRTMDGRLRRFAYEIDAATRLLVEMDFPSGALSAAVLPIPRERHELATAGRIDENAPSLFAAMNATGEGPELALGLAEVFAGEVDFNTELQRGDQFSLVFEKFTRDRGSSTYGAIEAAELQNEDRLLRAFRFTPPGGQPGYYDEQGRSLRRFFLRSPLKFEPRITSGFSRARFHPVLRTSRPHLGVDYGAPVGAPVVAVAAGRVVSTTSDRANGRMVRLRHTSGFETYYLHLSAFAPGVRAGTAVSQGQLIGRVGMTGLATGPHLDYRIRKDGVFVNPVSVHRSMPPGEPVPAEARAAFEAQRDRVLQRLKTLN